MTLPAGAPGRAADALPAEEPGLTSDQAAALLAEHGPNVLVPERRALSTLAMAGRVVRDPMVLLLFVASSVYLAIGSYSDAAATAIALVPIAAVSLALETRSERALERLRALTAPVVRTVRDGAEREVPAVELVPGDLVLLREGDVVPADARAVETTNLVLDESALTGESLPLTKSPAEDAALLAGTTVLAGRGAAVVTRTGVATEYGRVGRLVAAVKQPRTPLESVVRRLTTAFLGVASVFCLLVAGVELARGSGWGAAMIAGISLGIAAVPEEFPMVYTLYLAIGAWRLARHRALVRRLSGVEALGSASVICTDKTGTVTAGRMSVAELRPLEGTESELLRAALMASEQAAFDPLDVAIAEAGAGVERAGWTLLKDYGFDAEGRYVVHAWSAPEGRRLVAKGALETLLARTGASARLRKTAEAENERLAAEGMRVLAVAAGRLPRFTGDRDRDERVLRVIGLIGFADPLRPGVTEAVAECQSAGIRVVMITGDHPLTAAAIARALHLGGAGGQGPEAITTGAELERATPAERELLVARANVFARIRPEQKHELVSVLRRQGQVVAMTGDGINDAPALREADIGVAMGERGTEVAREAATLVLLDDNFSTIVTAVRDGRRIFRNLGKAFAYLVAFHVPLLLAALVVPLVGLPLLLLPVQLVLLELFVHPVVSLAFEAEPAPADIMRTPPRAANASMLPRRVVLRAALQGVVLCAAVLALYVLEINQGAPVGEARATAFAALLMGQMLMLVSERARPYRAWRSRAHWDRATLWTLLVAGAATAILVSVDPAARLLQLRAARPTEWLLAAAVAFLSTAWIELTKRSPAGSVSRRPPGPGPRLAA